MEQHRHQANQRNCEEKIVILEFSPLQCLDSARWLWAGGAGTGPALAVLALAANTQVSVLSCASNDQQEPVVPSQGCAWFRYCTL